MFQEKSWLAFIIEQHYRRKFLSHINIHIIIWGLNSHLFLEANLILVLFQAL